MPRVSKLLIVLVINLIKETIIKSYQDAEQFTK